MSRDGNSIIVQNAKGIVGNKIGSQNVHGTNAEGKLKHLPEVLEIYNMDIIELQKLKQELNDKYYILMSSGCKNKTIRNGVNCTE